MTLLSSLHLKLHEKYLINAFDLFITPQNNCLQTVLKNIL